MFRPWKHKMELRSVLHPDHPNTWQSPFAYLIGVVFVHSSLAVILHGRWRDGN
jgi:hypothetical protein